MQVIIMKPLVYPLVPTIDFFCSFAYLRIFSCDYKMFDGRYEVNLKHLHLELLIVGTVEFVFAYYYY